MNNSGILKQLNDNYNAGVTGIEYFRKGGSDAYVVHSNAGKLFLRIVSDAFMDTVINSIEMNLYLEANNIRVPSVIKNIKEQGYTIIKDKDVERVGILYKYIDGSELAEDESIETVGEFTGRLHSIMSTYKGKIAKRNKYFFIERYLKLLELKGYDARKISRFRTYGNELWRHVEGIENVCCHGDLHRGNFMKSQSGEIILLDFDSSCYASPMFDIMTFCDSTDYFQFSEDGMNRSEKVLTKFLKGYMRSNRLSNYEIATFLDWIGIRHYQLQATILEIYGLDCVDDKFIDNQLEWLMSWRKQCKAIR